MDHENLNLAYLPSDILTYLIYDVRPKNPIDEALSQNNSIEDPSEVRSRAFNLISDFLNHQNGCTPGLVRDAVINANFSPEEVLFEIFDEAIDFISKTIQLLDECHSLQSVVIRSKYSANRETQENIFELVPHLLKRPRLHTLIIEPCGIPGHGNFPKDEYLFEIEGASSESPVIPKSARGLTCFSFQAPMKYSYETDYEPYADFVKPIITANIKTLTRLWVFGPEFEKALQALPDGALSEMRLKSLSTHHCVGCMDMIRVFGLSVKYEDNGELCPGALNDALSGLEYLYLDQESRDVFEESNLIKYLYLPKLRSLCLGSGFCNMIQARRLFGPFLESLSSLEKLCFNKASFSNFYTQEFLTVLKPKLRSMAFWRPSRFTPATRSWTAKTLHKFENAELLLAKDKISLFFTFCDCFYVNQLSSPSRLSYLRIGYYFFEQRFLDIEQVAAVLSTVLHVWNIREGGMGVFRIDEEEDSLEQKVHIPARDELIERLFDKHMNLQDLGDPDRNKDHQDETMQNYLKRLMAASSRKEIKPGETFEAWMQDPLNGKPVLEQLVTAMIGYPWYSFKKLELRLKNLDYGVWPKNIEDVIFIWDKLPEGGWKFQKVRN